MFKIRQIVGLPETVELVCRIVGVFIAFSGIAVFSSGMKARIVERIRVCPNCFYKNNADLEVCRKCKKPLD